MQYFPEGTDELLASLQAELRGELQVDICIADEDYLELDLHSDELRIAKVVFDYVLWPLVFGKICNWLEGYRQRRRKELRVRARFILTRTPKGSSVEVDYDGPVTELRDALDRAVAALGRGEAGHCDGSCGH